MRQAFEQQTAGRGKRIGWSSRRGAVTVLAAFLLVGVFAFVAFAVDTGLMTLTQSEMQNAVDAAALAASQEITGAIFDAGQNGGDATIDANSIAVENARAMAAQVAELNGVFVDPNQDVQFGKRMYDASTETWPIEWGVGPYNVVKVSARRNNADTSQPDGRVRLSFGWAVGMTSVEMITSATAFVEARDIELVLDFSASMNDDSSIVSFGSLGQSNVEASLDGMWNALVAANPKWPGTTTAKFPSSGFGNVNSYYGTYVSSSTTSTIYSSLSLNQTVGGAVKYPFPQAGRNSSGLPNSKPSNSTSQNLWYGYIDYVKNLSGTYRKRYGYRTLMDYLQEQRYGSNQSEDLWRTRHYPFHAIKEGASLFLNFLTDLDFGDEVGLVSYGGYSQVETVLNDGDAYVNISADPITGVYADIDTIQRHKQAGHYDGWTGMGYGIKDAKRTLIGDPSNSSDHGHARYGARPTMIIMTDGQTNQGPSNWNLPSGWNWADWTDYDGDGDADYSTSDRKKQYAFWEATEAIRHGVTVHTMSVGADADRDLMEAIAFAGSGVWMNVPGGTTVAAMESQLLDAFRQIAAKVPPAKLIHSASN
ncbi:MAG: vWA domain-containing protein [Planctomycetota bacterium]